MLTKDCTLSISFVSGFLKLPSLIDGNQYKGRAQILTEPFMYPPGVIIDVMLCRESKHNFANYPW